MKLTFNISENIQQNMDKSELCDLNQCSLPSTAVNSSILANNYNVNNDYKTYCNGQNVYQWDNKLRNKQINPELFKEQLVQEGSMQQQLLVSQDKQKEGSVNPYLESMITTTYDTATAKKRTKTKRIRTAYTSPQLVQLEKEFQAGRYLSRSRRIQIASDLKLSEKQVKVWFQNRRMKFKKEDPESSKSIESVDTSNSMSSSNAITSEASFETSTNSSITSTWLTTMAQYFPDILHRYPDDKPQNSNQAISSYGIQNNIQPEIAQNCPQAIASTQQMQVQSSRNSLLGAELFQQMHSYQQQANYSDIHSQPQDNNNYFHQQWSNSHVQSDIELHNANSYAPKQSNCMFDSTNRLLNQTIESLHSSESFYEDIYNYDRYLQL